MSLLDIAVVAILAISGLLAFFRGMVKELLALTGWVAGGLAVLFGLPYARPYAREVIPIEIVADVAAGLGIFIIVIILVAIVTHGISEKVRDSSFSTLDRSLGLLFGLLRGFILVSLLYILLVLAFPTPESKPDWMTDARTVPALAIGGCTLLQLAPDSFDDTKDLVCDPESGSRTNPQDQGPQDQGPRDRTPQQGRRDSGDQTRYTNAVRRRLDQQTERIR